MRFLLGLWHQLWITAVVALLLLALYTSLGRQLIPLVETLRPDVEALLSEELGRPVQIEKFSGDWHYLAPILKIHGLSVGAEASAARLELLEIELDISASAYHQQPVFNRIEASGLDATIEIREGLWQLAGFTLFNASNKSLDKNLAKTKKNRSNAQAGRIDWIQLLELQHRVSLSDSHIRVIRDGRLAHRTHIHDLAWRHQGDSQTFHGSLAWGRDRLADIDLDAALTGPLWPWSNQNGEVVARIEPQSWAGWMPEDLPLGLSVNSLKAGGELWLKVRNGDLSEAYGDFSIRELEVTGNSEPIAIDSVGILVGGRHTGQDWHLRLKADSADRLPLNDMTISSVTLGEERGWQLGLDQVNLGQVNGFLNRHALLPSPFDRYLGNISPQGRADNVRVSLLTGESMVLDVKADLINASGQPYAGIPGISGLNATVHLQPHQGRVRARNQSIKLDLAGVYDQPWSLTETNADFYWQIGPDISHIWLDGLNGRSSDMSFVAAASMELPSPRLPELEPRLRFLLGVPKADVKNRDQVLPDLLEPEVRQWIVDAFYEGQLTNGALLLDGVMEEHRAENSLTTQLLMDLDGIRMSYLEGWPEVHSGKGRFFLNVPDVDVQVESLQTLGGELVKNSGRIRLTPELGNSENTPEQNKTPSSSSAVTRLGESSDSQMTDSREADEANEPETDANAKPANPTRLIVEGKMTGPVAEALAYFQQTPLQEVVNHGFDDWRGEGQLTGEMTLSMLLGEAVPEPDVKLRAWLEEDAVSLQGLNLEFTDISGVLDFDSRNGISSEQLQANLFGGPVQASITSTPGEAGFSTEIQANGRAQVADIRNWMPNVLLAPVSGDLGYNARFSFDTTNGHTELDIETPLDGTLIDYPEPFFKAANDVSQPLRVTMSIAATDAEPRVWMNFNDRVRGIFALNDIGVERGQVYIGSLEPYLPSDSGIEIRGELIEPVVAEPWWDSWVELQELALKPPYLLPAQSSKAATSVSSRAADGAVANNQTGSSPAVAENPVRSIDLKLPNLTAATIPVPKFHVTAGQSMGEWRFQVASDVVGGNVVVPASAEQPVLLNLDYVHLPPAEEPISDVPVEQSVGLDDQLQQLLAEDMLVDMVPGDLLPMNLNLKELFVGGLNLGSWKVESRPIKGGATIRILESDMKGLQISGDLRWLLQNKQHSTQVDTMQIRATNLADVQSAFRMEPMMDAKNGRASLSLSWLGSPMAFNPNSLNGMGSFRLENGVWKAEGAGAIRAFGLLNFDSISRRLQLDFSDVYKSGVAFDTVKAKAKIEEGRLTLVEPFISNGPGAKFLMSGSTDLVAETMDMKLAVTFPVTSSLPLVAVLAGFAAPVAASIYVTEKLIGDELERFTSASYDVRGSWSEPDMKIRGAFDNQVDGKKSKSLKDRVLSIFGLDEAE